MRSLSKESSLSSFMSAKSPWPLHLLVTEKEIQKRKNKELGDVLVQDVLASPKNLLKN